MCLICGGACGGVGSALAPVMGAGAAFAWYKATGILKKSTQKK